MLKFSALTLLACHKGEGGTEEEARPDVHIFPQFNPVNNEIKKQSKCNKTWKDSGASCNQFSDCFPGAVRPLPPYLRKSSVVTVALVKEAKTMRVETRLMAESAPAVVSPGYTEWLLTHWFKQSPLLLST